MAVRAIACRLVSLPRFIIKVKKPVEIVLSSIHVGEARRVVTLGMDGRDHADRFLNQLRKHDRNLWEFIRKRIRAVANHDRYANELTFKHVGDGVFEFKRPGIRLYAFYDEIDGIGHLILCTNGGGKGNRKEQNADIQTAKAIRNSYFSAKQLEDTLIILAEAGP